jgi:hypothetical protein
MMQRCANGLKKFKRICLKNNFFWRKIMRLICLLFLMWSQFSLLAQGPESSFGTVAMQIDSGEADTYYIKSAVLFQNASVGFDTTVQIQSAVSNEILYYPQILEGEDNILRLILALNEDNFYDVVFNVGDSLGDTLVYNAVDSRVFFNYDGQLNTFEQTTRNLNGQILLTQSDPKEKQISGEIDVSFELPRDKELTRTSTITLAGTFSVYFGEFRSVSLATGTPLQKNKKKYVNNLVVAVALATIGFFVFLAR